MSTPVDDNYRVMSKDECCAQKGARGWGLYNALKEGCQMCPNITFHEGDGGFDSLGDQGRSEWKEYKQGEGGGGWGGSEEGELVGEVDALLKK